MARERRSVADDLEKPECLDRFGLAFQDERLDLLDDDRVPHEQPRLGADEHLTARGSLLEPRGDVDRVAGDERVALAADDDLARCSAPIRASSPCSAIAARISDAARTARNASSSCETGIPKTAITASPTNFSTDPPCRSMIDAQVVEVATHAGAERLGIGRLAERGRADEVAEEDRDDLALLAGRLGDGERAFHTHCRSARRRRSRAPQLGQSDTRGVYEGPCGVEIVERGSGACG